MSENFVIAPRAGEEVRYPEIYRTQPERITWHFIEDHELDKLANVSRPIVLGLSTTFLGSTVGLLPSLQAALANMAREKLVGAGDVFIIAASVSCLALTIAFGFFAIRGQLDASKLKGEIRGRRPSQLFAGRWQNGTGEPG